MSFETAYKFTKRFEGGYANASKDAGGETFQGISRVAWPAWAGWNIIDEVKALIQPFAEKFINSRKLWTAVDNAVEDNKELTALVENFYKNNFYDKTKKHGFPEKITDKMFDIFVNISPKNASKILQKAINSLVAAPINVDGALGPETVAAVAKLAVDDLLKAICNEQWIFYQNGVLKTFPNAAQSFKERAVWQP